MASIRFLRMPRRQQQAILAKIIRRLRKTGRIGNKPIDILQAKANFFRKLSSGKSSPPFEWGTPKQYRRATINELLKGIGFTKKTLNKMSNTTPKKSRKDAFNLYQNLRGVGPETGVFDTITGKVYLVGSSKVLKNRSANTIKVQDEIKQLKTHEKLHGIYEQLPKKDKTWWQREAKKAGLEGLFNDPYVFNSSDLFSETGVLTTRKKVDLPEYIMGISPKGINKFREYLGLKKLTKKSLESKLD